MSVASAQALDQSIRHDVQCQLADEAFEALAAIEQAAIRAIVHSNGSDLICLKALSTIIDATSSLIERRNVEAG
jgi:hypothetical protein